MEQHVSEQYDSAPETGEDVTTRNWATLNKIHALMGRTNGS